MRPFLSGWPTPGPPPPPPPPADAGWPRISIVTPSYNQAPYLEMTLRSVILQGYPNLEYIVMEDGSKDDSPAILERYHGHFAALVAQPNRGFGAVLHDGLSRATGEIMAWLNSDDLHLPGTLATVAEVFTDCPEVDWVVGGSLLCDGSGRVVGTNFPPGFSRRLFFSGRYLGGHPAWNGRWIPQESVFWRRRLWEQAGARFIPERLQYGDFELWSRFWKHADLHMLPVPLGVYRIHPQTYTAQRGNDSTGPCTALLQAAGEPALTPVQLRLRDLVCRQGRRFLERWGEPARTVRYDPAASRWQAGSTKLL